MSNVEREGKGSLRMALIGAGAMGQTHCRTIMESVPEMTLSAVVDAHEDTACKVGEQYGVPSYTSIEEMIAGGEADAALVSTPHPLHKVAAVACLKGGLHVLSEKPLAETISAADEMLHTARANELVLGVMFQRRFEPVFEAALRFVREGSLGDIRRTLLLLPDFRAQAYFEANAWRATWKGEGGGVLINQSPHMLDWFVLLAGQPDTLQGYTRTSCFHDIEVEDQAEALLHYANGATGYLYASTTEPQDETLEIIGTRGRLAYRRGHLECSVYDEDIEMINADAGGVWRRPQIRDATPVVEEIPANKLQGLLMQNFARHILHGDPLRCDAESGSLSLELSNAIALSSHLQEPVSLPVQREAYDALLDRLQASSKSRKKVIAEVRLTDPKLV